MTKQQRIDNAVLLLRQEGWTVTPPSNLLTVQYASVPDFEDFWESYDKKVGRTKAEKLWNSLSPKDKISCMEYVPLYVRNTPDKLYRKNPETFLRNKCWNDELITPDNGTDKRTQHHQEQLAGTLGRIASLLRD